MGFSLKEYLWMKKFKFRPCCHIEDIGWTTVTIRGIITAPINCLRASIVTQHGNERRRIENTPHYKWIKSLVSGVCDDQARQQYHEYLQTFFPEIDSSAMAKNVIMLVESICSSNYPNGTITIITKKPKRKFGFGPYYLRIFDGVHRSSCAKALGHTHVNCMIKTGF